jgi:acyl-CoA synthetase (AMP-forming)/AMP-acid ligase II
MNVCELFESASAGSPARPALIGGVHASRQVESFASLRRRAETVALQFQARGLRPGDRVLLAVPMSIDTYVVMLGILRAGLVVTFIDPAHGMRRITGILEAWPPDAIVTTRAAYLLRFLVQPLRRIRHRFFVGGRESEPHTLSMAPATGRINPVVRRSPADSALLTFTSGSTGEPKPAIRTHGFLKRQLEVLKPVATLREGDIDFVAMPMFVLFNLANGITSIIPACDMKHPSRANPDIVYTQLKFERATRMVASPALLVALANWCNQKGQLLPDLRLVCTGGGPVDPSLPTLLGECAPGADLRMVYGSTEAEPIAAIDASAVSTDARRKMRRGDGLPVGRPVPGCDVRIAEPGRVNGLGQIDEAAFDRLAQPSGQVGEIIVAGKHVLSGYADAARNRETKIAVGDRIWHRTGDAGYLDAAGCLWLVGRCDAAIHDEHGTVYPFQVEYAIHNVPGIRRAALIQRHGRRLLVLETRGRRFERGCKAISRCIDRHHIDGIITVRRIPVDKRHNAKVDYPALRSMIEGRWTILLSDVAQVASSGWRYLKNGLGRARFHCHATDRTTTVDGCHPETD